MNQDRFPIPPSQRLCRPALASIDVIGDNVIALPVSRVGGAVPSSPPDMSALERAGLEKLRAYVLESQLCNRAHLNHICAIVQADQELNLRNTALAFFGALSEFATQKLRFFRPGTVEFSDAEIWLLRVLAAFEDYDTPEGRALIAWRVHPCGQRRLRFLAGRLADAVHGTRAPGTSAPVQQTPT